VTSAKSLVLHDGGKQKVLIVNFQQIFAAQLLTQRQYLDGLKRS
jgi:hypothetical protein